MTLTELRWIAHFLSADPAWGNGVANSLGFDKMEIAKLALLASIAGEPFTSDGTMMRATTRLAQAGAEDRKADPLRIGLFFWLRQSNRGFRSSTISSVPVD